MENQYVSIEEQQIEQVFNEMIDNIEDVNLKTMLQSKFVNFKIDFDGKRIGYSLNSFIKAELDFQNLGDRGIGRISEQIPRFGGYYRKQLSQINPEKIKELYDLMNKIMLSSYLTGVLMLSESVGSGLA